MREIEREGERKSERAREKYRDRQTYRDGGKRGRETDLFYFWDTQGKPSDESEDD